MGHAGTDRQTTYRFIDPALHSMRAVSSSTKDTFNGLFFWDYPGEQWHQLDHMQVCTSLQTDNHASTPPLSFLQAGRPSCCPSNSIKALKADQHVQQKTTNQSAHFHGTVPRVPCLASIGGRLARLGGLPTLVEPCNSTARLGTGTHHLRCTAQPTNQHIRLDAQQSPTPARPAEPRE